MDKDELQNMIISANERANTGRLIRLQFLMEKSDDSLIPFSGLAYEYYEEARLCWYVGAYVATIVMGQLAMEETLRSYFRVVGGVKGNLSTGKQVDRAGFADLINECRLSKIISDIACQQLDTLRNKLRNPYVHPKDISSNDDRTSDFFKQRLKISSPELVRQSVENEAKEAISILINLLPKISGTLFGKK